MCKRNFEFAGADIGLGASASAEFQEVEGGAPAVVVLFDRIGAMIQPGGQAWSP